MRFLADESCDFSVVRILRAAGYDVLAIAELAPQTGDPEVIELSVREGRVLLTEDKDFGQLVYAGAHESNGVVLIRFPSTDRAELPNKALQAIRSLGDRLVGAFIVLEPNRIRIGRTPHR
jgi:predicted nuclease of predicted toxin-antitoxin system